MRESSSPASDPAGVTLRILGDAAVAYGATHDVARTVTTHLFGISPNNSGSTFLQRALATCRATWNLLMEGQRMPGFAGPASFRPLVPGEPPLGMLWAADRRWRDRFADPGAVRRNPPSGRPLRASCPSTWRMSPGTWSRTAGRS